MGTRRSSSALARVLICLVALAVAASAVETAHEPAHRMLTKRRHHPSHHSSHHHSQPKHKASPHHDKAPVKASKGSSDIPPALQELYDNLGSHHCYKGVQLDRNPRPCASGAPVRRLTAVDGSAGNSNNTHYVRAVVDWRI